MLKELIIDWILFLRIVDSQLNSFFFPLENKWSFSSEQMRTRSFCLQLQENSFQLFAIID
jgi:hypothetical protein